MKKASEKQYLSCGFWKLRPAFMQKMATMKLFVVFLVLYVMSYGAMSGFSAGLVTTYAKRFDLNTTLIGMFGFLADMGFTISVLFISYFGNRLHRPRIIGFAALGMGVVGLLMAMPYFLFGAKYSHEKLLQRAHDTDFIYKLSDADDKCAVGYLKEFNGSWAKLAAWSSDIGRLMSVNPDAASEMQPIERTISLIILGIGCVLSGALVSPFWSVAPPMIEDNVDSDESGSYIGTIMAFRFLAPVLGLLFLVWALNQPEDFRANGLNPMDSMWIGAWWSGYVIFGALTFIAAIPLLMFPKEFPKATDQEIDTKTMLPATTHEKTGNDRIKFKDIFRAFCRLLSDPVYVLLNVYTVIIMIGHAVSLYFGTMYIEVYFNLSASQANLIGGVALAGSVCIGCFVGGMITSHFKLTLERNFVFILVISVLLLILSIPIYLLKCPTETVNGVHVNIGMKWNQHPCQRSCYCTATYFPVCGADNVLFDSPCQAGCLARNKSSYSDCRCVNFGGNSTYEPQTARSGLCHPMCNNVYFYIALTVVAGLLGGSTFSASYLVIMRLPKNKEDVGLALGIGNFIYGILGIITGPVGGMLLEEVCIKTLHTAVGEFCVLYDKQKLNFLVNGISLISKVPGVLVLLVAWYFLRKRLAREFTQSRMAPMTLNHHAVSQ